MQKIILLISQSPDLSILVSRTISFKYTFFVAIPFPHATDNHQYLNAKKYHDLNCCWILEEKNFNSGDMAKLINKIFINKNDYLKKKSNLKKLKDKNKWENINNEFKKILNDN